MWRDLGTALCLVLIIEGIWPFLDPARWRRLVASLAQVDDSTLRLAGLVSMVVGAGLLYLVR